MTTPTSKVPKLSSRSAYMDHTLRDLYSRFCTGSLCKDSIRSETWQSWEEVASAIWWSDLVMVRSPLSRHGSGSLHELQCSVVVPEVRRRETQTDDRRAVLALRPPVLA